jgi:hypothetical protein
MCTVEDNKMSYQSRRIVNGTIVAQVAQYGMKRVAGLGIVRTRRDGEFKSLAMSEYRDGVD